MYIDLIAAAEHSWIRQWCLLPLSLKMTIPHPWWSIISLTKWRAPSTPYPACSYARAHKTSLAVCISLCLCMVLLGACVYDFGHLSDAPISWNTSSATTQHQALTFPPIEWKTCH